MLSPSGETWPAPPRRAQVRNGQGGSIEGIDCLRIKVAGQFSYDHPRPVVHLVKSRIALAGETPEHVRTGIAEKDHKTRAGRRTVLRHWLEPAERREGCASNGVENGVVHAENPLS